VTLAVSVSHRTARGASIEVREGTVDIISAYREVGTYRGAATISGTTHKTVRRSSPGMRPAPWRWRGAAGAAGP
jgi:hypothetical protein